MFNLADSTWIRQPTLMTPAVADFAAQRAIEHAQRHDLDSISIVLHGGEPLYGGLAHVRMIVDAIKSANANSGVVIHIGMQTNAVLLTPEILDYCEGEGLTISVSVDGPPEYSNLTRINHAGRGMANEVERGLELLSSPRMKEAFSGILAVVDLRHDPTKVMDYLLSWPCPAVDLLLPLDNHDRLPLGLDQGSTDAPYGRWMSAAFDRWLDSGSASSVRYFESIIRLLHGKGSLVEAVGLGEVSIAVVESDGSIEALDALKSAFEGATKMDMSVFDNEFEDAAQHYAVRSRQLGLASLAEKCKNCELVSVCGGGYLPHRYSDARKFDNPSVYCLDLKFLISHIARRCELIGETSP